MRYGYSILLTALIAAATPAQDVTTTLNSEAAKTLAAIAATTPEKNSVYFPDGPNLLSHLLATGQGPKGKMPSFLGYPSASEIPIAAIGAATRPVAAKEFTMRQSRLVVLCNTPSGAPFQVTKEWADGSRAAGFEVFNLKGIAAPAEAFNAYVSKQLFPEDAEKPAAKRRTVKAVEPRDLERNVLVALTATRFDGVWSTPFNGKSKGDFVTDGGTVSTEFMTKTDSNTLSVSLDARKGWGILYRGDVAFFVLPCGTTKGTLECLDDLGDNAGKFKVEKAEPGNYEVSMPKMSIKFESDLKKAYAQRGAIEPFSESPDLTRLNPITPLKVSIFRQSAWIEIDNVGSRGGEVTKLAVVPRSGAALKGKLKLGEPSICGLYDLKSGRLLAILRIVSPR